MKNTKLVFAVSSFAAIALLAGTGCSKPKVKFHFDPNMDGLNVTTLEISKGSTVTPIDTPKKDGYTFKTWKVSKDADAKDFDFSTKIEIETTIYGSWIDFSSSAIEGERNVDLDATNLKYVAKNSKGEAYEDVSWSSSAPEILNINATSGVANVPADSKGGSVTITAKDNSAKGESKTLNVYVASYSKLNVEHLKQYNAFAKDANISGKVVIPEKYYDASKSEWVEISYLYHEAKQEGGEWISQGAFGGSGTGVMICPNITEVYIPKTIKEIPFNTFQSCTELSAVSLPDTLTEIGGYSFQSCKKLKNITIPSSVTSISGQTFKDNPDIIVTFAERKDMTWKLVKDGEKDPIRIFKVDQPIYNRDYLSVAEDDYNNYDATPTEDEEFVPATAITIDETNPTWSRTDEDSDKMPTLKAAVTEPETASDKEVVWTIDDEDSKKIASIDHKTGKISANDPSVGGKIKVKAVSRSNPEVTAETTLELIAPTEDKYFEFTDDGWGKYLIKAKEDSGIDDLKTICIPKKHDGKDVTLDYWHSFGGFYDEGKETYTKPKCQALERLIFNDSTTIFDGAFQGCKNLKEVLHIDNLTEIKQQAFGNISNDATIFISKTVTTFGEGIFNGDTYPKIEFEDKESTWKITHSDGLVDEIEFNPNDSSSAEKVKKYTHWNTELNVMHKWEKNVK